ncbi:TPA: pheST operon leader peptide PheM [Enterobacter cloacae]|nr:MULTISPECIES: pheST operon leader peptide PheM [Enterobacteriaceae]ELJ7034530.1 pheST operon leader peptide PheM [Salmonella enterica]EHK4750411.1 pheST operon leader peptide PheM [Escherichia coli]EIH0401299.1 pheST operon leader peptide PheM [Escherichia coli]ELE4888732.1 pheST operon leader peptide PheM [Escherichia coli]ELI3101153.1 pheST operon leader peptide PheM [Escherichia coli]
MNAAISRFFFYFST